VQDCDSSWQLQQLLIEPCELLPVDCLIVGVGLVCWQGPGATSSASPDAASWEAAAAIFLGMFVGAWGALDRSRVFMSILNCQDNVQ